MTAPFSPAKPRRALRWTLGAGALALLCCGALTYAVTEALDSDEAPPTMDLASCGLDAEVIAESSGLPTVRDLDDKQTFHAAVIVQVGQEQSMPPRAWVIAVATAMQESTLHNYGHLGEANDHDSLGLFQQRPSQGWGTPEELVDPYYAARAFYTSLAEVEGWEQMDLTAAAQRVQKSAFPDAYAKWEPLATDVVNVLTDGAALTSAVEGELGECAGPGEVAATGWIAPVPQGVVSGFRTPQRPDHQGVDLGSPRNTEVRAAAGGVVLAAYCNAYAPDGSEYSCDVDGSPQIRGCGWMVNIEHADGVMTRYCHFQVAPYVKEGDRVRAGQVIGVSGTSGSSSGPHLHFEVHRNGDLSRNGAVNPVAWMSQQGAPLGEG